MKKIVVYFSRPYENYFGGKIKSISEGNTKVVAKKIAEALDCDLFELVPLHEYPKDYRECVALSKAELEGHILPKMKEIISGFDEYDTVYLGYPNWCSTYPMIVETFLESCDLKGKHIYPFCTHEGSGMGRSEADLKKVCPDSILHRGLAIYGHDALNCDKQIKQWLKVESI